MNFLSPHNNSLKFFFFLLSSFCRREDRNTENRSFVQDHTSGRCNSIQYMVTHWKADEVWGLHSAMLSPPSPLKLYIVTRHKVMFSSPTLARLLSHCQQVNLPLGGRPSGLHLFFKLKYSQFTMLYQFLVYIKVIQLYSQ